MSMALVRSLPEDEWRQFVEKHPEGNVFHTPEMFRVFSHSRDYKPELWAVTENGRILAFFLPVRRTLMKGLLQKFATRSVAYGSVLCVPGCERQRALARLLESYTREAEEAGTPLFTELRNQSKLEEEQPILRK